VTVICALITVYIVVLFARAILSWFPISHGSPVASIYRILLDLTEPVLAPMRRVIPPAGMFDLSFLVLTIGLFILRGVVCAAA
jgi:YggT family protein